jgi:hypothetical protein
MMLGLQNIHCQYMFYGAINRAPACSPAGAD